MRYLLSLLCLLTIYSCGKNQDSKSAGSPQGRQQHRGYIDLGAAGTSEPDLLNVTLDLPVEISTDRIQFLQAASKTDQGSRTSCSLSVTQNEIWHFSMSGNNLRVDMSDGSILQMKRVSSFGSGASGVWSWAGENNGLKLIRRFTLLNGRLIINQDCEG